eukprot:COSAG01_NODE_122_length_25212_cov_25.945646_29_plen_99_part_00
MPSTVQDVAAARDEFVTAVWTDTLPTAVEQDLRSHATATGTMYHDLLSLNNQYYTALTVLAEHGITSAGNIEPDNHTKRMAIMTARSMLTNSEPSEAH